MLFSESKHICKISDFKPIFNSYGKFKCKICGKILYNPTLLDILNNDIRNSSKFKK